MDPLHELALAIKAAHRELERRTNEAMRPLGLTGPQADALTVIRQAQPVSLKELGALLIVEGGHPSRFVERLVDRGWVRREAAAEDRRRVVLSLTPAGSALERRAADARHAVLELGRAIVGDRDLVAIRELLADLLQYSEYAGLIERRRQLDQGP